MLQCSKYITDWETGEGIFKDVVGRIYSLVTRKKQTQKIYTPGGCLHENIRGPIPRENP